VYRQLGVIVPRPAVGTEHTRIVVRLWGDTIIVEVDALPLPPSLLAFVRNVRTTLRNVHILLRPANYGDAPWLLEARSAVLAAGVDRSSD
jgi:hypothetical protein